MAGTRAGSWSGQHRLELRVGVVGELGLPEHLPVLQILVDGRELLAGPHGSDPDRYFPSPPGALLGQDEPLLPACPARRVVLYICSCGFPGCGCISAVIRTSGDLVIWSDFRRGGVSGTFGLPVLEPDPPGSSPVGITDVAFGRDQYVAEVRRVAGAREWQTDRWAPRRNEHGPWRTTS